MQVTIDSASGFCWGVVRTIEKVEETLNQEQGKDVFILGDVIHNPKEIERLEKKGLKTISHKDLSGLDPQNSKVLIRAHGEPPETYRRANELGINLIDATCPLVTSLQKRVADFYRNGYQIVIFGKKEHAEVIGLRGVCNDECIVVKSVEEALESIDFERKTVLISQTTMDRPTFFSIKEAIEGKVSELVDVDLLKERFVAKDTLCKAVYGREEKLREFAAANDAVLFVAGRNSSNGKSLFRVCKENNPNTHFIEDIGEIDGSWFLGVEKVGITGATSTPQWFMEEVKNYIEINF